MGDQSGWSVASAGDGIDDLIVGAKHSDPNGSYSGASYVVFGSNAGFAANLDLSTLNGTNGFRISGVTAYDQSGWSVASAGDVNGDGIDAGGGDDPAFAGGITTMRRDTTGDGRVDYQMKINGDVTGESADWLL